MQQSGVAAAKTEFVELGDVSGKRVLHLQCHIGRDTLCLARRGAIATGLDFSPVAIKVARRLVEETGLNVTFQALGLAVPRSILLRADVIE